MLDAFWKKVIAGAGVLVLVVVMVHYTGLTLDEVVKALSTIVGVFGA